MALKLSICICTTSARQNVIRPLLKTLKHQAKKYPGQVEILINDHETDNVGKKRNELLNRAQGNFVVAVDSDDMVAADYIKKILHAIKSDPDCIGISGWITTDGKNAMDWHISREYGSWYKLGRKYFRTPNHISPVRREIALQVMFPETSHGEDYDFSKRILPLLKTEVKVPGKLYHYKFVNK